MMRSIGVFIVHKDIVFRQHDHNGIRTTELIARTFGAAMPELAGADQIRGNHFRVDGRRARMLKYVTRHAGGREFVRRGSAKTRHAPATVRIVRVSNETHRQLRIIAAAEQRSMKDLVAEAVRDMVERYGKRRAEIKNAKAEKKKQ